MANAEDNLSIKAQYNFHHSVFVGLVFHLYVSRRQRDKQTDRQVDKQTNEQFFIID